MDVTARYRISPRVSIAVTLPIADNKFSLVLPPDGPGGTRHNILANGIGDVSIFAQSWLFKPKDHPFANIALGVGIKTPTGRFNVQTNLPNENGLGYMKRVAFPPSIMPGDGGTGIILGVEGFKNIRKPLYLRGQTVFASASYLINPRDTNGTASINQSLGVPLAPNFANSLYNSVTDSYNIQAGASIKLPYTWDKPLVKGLRGRLVWGMQGIPRHDLIGHSDGLRSAGYIMSIAPGMTYAHGNNYYIVEVPITFSRYIYANDTAVAELPIMTPQGPSPAPLNRTNNLGMVAPVAIAMRYVRTF